MIRISRTEVFCKNGVKILRNSQENNSARVSFLNFIKKETLTQVFSCEFCKISKNIFSYRTPSAAASVWYYHRVMHGSF